MSLCLMPQFFYFFFNILDIYWVLTFDSFLMILLCNYCTLCVFAKKVLYMMCRHPWHCFFFLYIIAVAFITCPWPHPPSSVQVDGRPSNDVSCVQVQWLQLWRTQPPQAGDPELCRSCSLPLEVFHGKSSLFAVLFSLRTI